jgi:Family of unknown function (DUF6314)
MSMGGQGRRVTDEVFEDLQGCWNLARKIEGFGAMQGLSRIRMVSPQIFEYREEGTLILNAGGEFAAFRTLFYCREDDDIVVRFKPSFSDEDTLHRLRLVNYGPDVWPSCADDTHYCGRDTYRGHYCFEVPGRVRIRVAVNGPKKNSVIDTLLSKI